MTPPTAKRLRIGAGLILGLLLLLGSWQRRIPFGLTESLGFVTGAACVYLVIRQNIWNFPLGIANNVFFFALFMQTRLYGDAGLQVFYLLLGVQGWYWWMYGGQNRSALRVTRASPRLLMVLGAFTLLGTPGLMLLLRGIGGSAPLLDSFTTVLSLCAQYLLNRKALENWYVWITADVLYVYLYFTRGLHLTALLYLVFLGLCVAGLLEWGKALRQDRLAPSAASGAAMTDGNASSSAGEHPHG